MSPLRTGPTPTETNRAERSSAEGKRTMSQDWKWYASRNEEDYTVGPEDTREAVIEAATNDFDGEPFHVIEATKGTFKRWLPTADRILEEMTERADDDGCCGEDEYAELHGPDAAIEAAAADLNEVLSAWYDRHAAIFPTPWIFAQTRNGEWITPAPEAEPARAAPAPTALEQG